MKKAFIAVLVIACLAFNGEKKYALQLNEQELQALWYCVDQSQAPHMTVKQVQELIQKQVGAQADSTKK